MDLNDLRSAVTVAGLLLFLAIVRSAWRRSRRAEFDQAARLPFEGDTLPAAPAGRDAVPAGDRP